MYVIATEMERIFMEEFRNQLKKAMNLRNMTQKELCEKTKIPKSAMSQYESGAFKPKQERTYLIAKALNVNEAWLMGFDDVPMERDPDKNLEPLKNEQLSQDEWEKILKKEFTKRGIIKEGADITKEQYEKAIEVLRIFFNNSDN